MRVLAILPIRWRRIQLIHRSVCLTHQNIKKRLLPSSTMLEADIVVFGQDEGVSTLSTRRFRSRELMLARFEDILLSFPRGRWNGDVAVGGGKR